MSQIILKGKYCHILMALSGQRIESFLRYETGSNTRSCSRQPLLFLLSSLTAPGLFQRLADAYISSIPSSFPLTSAHLHLQSHNSGKAANHCTLPAP